MRHRHLPLWAFAAVGVLTPLGAGVAGAAVASPPRWLPMVPLDGSASESRLIVALAVLAALPLATLWFRGGRRRTALLCLWVGTFAAALGASAAAPGAQLRGVFGVFGEIAIVLLLLLTGFPLLVGALCQALIEEGLRFVRRRREAPPAIPPARHTV